MNIFVVKDVGKENGEKTPQMCRPLVSQVAEIMAENFQGRFTLFGGDLAQKLSFLCRGSCGRSQEMQPFVPGASGFG